MVAAFDQSVGVEGEQGALGQFDLHLLEGLPADAERQPGGTSSISAVSPGSTRTGGRWPALAKVQRRVTES
ncbi:hypothetical protein SANTM175S_00212 [Streptomyces antimycoticus]